MEEIRCDVQCGGAAGVPVNISAKQRGNLGKDPSTRSPGSAVFLAIGGKSHIRSLIWWKTLGVACGEISN